MWIKGSNLTPDQKSQVLNAFPYRWTRENWQRLDAYKPCPLCDIANPYVNEQSANGHNHPTIPLGHDSDWLNEHAFNFTKAGNRLAFRPQYCITITELEGRE